MEVIKVDSDVFAFLQRHAKPFVDTPNSTLRRLLGVEESSFGSGPAENGDSVRLLPEDQGSASNRAKARKANLVVLAEAGLVSNGEKLHLIDYQGNRAQNFCAAVSGGDLTHNGRRYSMSNLAQELLTKLGFRSNSVRGPAHWVNEAGVSIKELWQQYLDESAKN